MKWRNFGMPKRLSEVRRNRWYGMLTGEIFSACGGRPTNTQTSKTASVSARLSAMLCYAPSDAVVLDEDLVHAHVCMCAGEKTVMYCDSGERTAQVFTKAAKLSDAPRAIIKRRKFVGDIKKSTTQLGHVRDRE